MFVEKDTKNNVRDDIYEDGWKMERIQQGG